MKHWYYIFLLWSYTNILAAQVPDSIYTADSRLLVQDLSDHTSILVDSSLKVTVQDLIKNEEDSDFQPITAFKNKIESSVAYWLKVQIRSVGDFQDWWLLLRDKNSTTNYYTQNCYIDTYVINAAQRIINHQRSGAFVPFAQKSVKGSPAVSQVLFSTTAGSQQTIYIRIYNEFSTPNNVPILELRHSNLPLPPHPASKILNILSAIAFTFCVLSFFFFLFTQEKSYLFFTFYTLALANHYLILNPALPFINWYLHQHPDWITQAWVLLSSLVFIFIMLFGRTFIDLPRLSRTTDRFLLLFMAVWSVSVGIELTALSINRNYLFLPYLTLPFFIILTGFIIRLAFFKNIFARFFVAGAFWLLIFSILGFLWESKIIHLPFNPWPVGQMGQLLIFSIGLAYKVRLNEQAKAEADRIQDLDALKSRFFANISHEFRTPLTLIQGPLKKIEQEHALNGKPNGLIQVPQRYLQTMRHNTDRLLELVNQLLDLARLDSGKMQLQVTKGDVLQLLKALVYSFDSMAERQQIHYQTHFPEGTVIGCFDKDKLEKIVVNLLGNAFKYTPEKGIVSVKMEIEEQRLRITVEDSGTGIPKKELDKVFDRFYQVEGNEDKGSGIGLALVKELVEVYRGQISVSSEPGKGSRFKVSLPVDFEAFRPEEMASAVESASYNQVNVLEENVANGAILTHYKEDKPLLLVVEDNLALRQFIIEILQNEYNVIEAKNGKQGLELATAQIPDLIVSDVMMPMMNGFVMTEKLKKDERTSHIPIILLTAKASQQHKIEGLDTGADDYLIKPFDGEELLIRIKNLIQQRRLLRQKFAGQIVLKPSEMAATSAEAHFLQKVMQAIESNISDEYFGVEELAGSVAMSRSQLHRKLTALLEQSPSDLIRQTRLQRAKSLLEQKAGTPSEIAFQVGFNSHTYFSKCFKEAFGLSPSEVT